MYISWKLAQVDHHPGRPRNLDVRGRETVSGVEGVP